MILQPRLGLDTEKIIFQNDTCIPILRAALLTIAKTQSPPKTSTEQKNEGLWGTSLTGILLSCKTKIMVLAAAWMDQEIFILSKVVREKINIQR